MQIQDIRYNVTGKDEYRDSYYKLIKHTLQVYLALRTPKYTPCLALTSDFRALE